MSNGTKGTTYNAPEEIRELKGNQFNNYGKAPIQKNRMEPNFVGTGDHCENFSILFESSTASQ